jgi:hypothetical protein
VTKKVRQPSADPYRKARFRELAREIVFKDRQDRRSGYAVDTAGSIARALERAFREGFEGGQTEGPAPGTGPHVENQPIEWALIPPRPRDAFWSICLFCIGRKEHPKGEAKLIAALTGRGTPGWLLTTSEDREIRIIGDGSVVPLIRLGLLERADDPSPSLIISDLGKMTWRRFLERGGQYPEDLTASDTIRPR